MHVSSNCNEHEQNVTRTASEQGRRTGEPKKNRGQRKTLYFQRADMKCGILHWMKTLGSATCQGTIVLFLAFILCQRCLGFVSMSRCLRDGPMEVEVGYDVELLCRDSQATEMLWTYTPLGNGSLQPVGNCTKEKQDWQCQVDDEYYQLTALNAFGSLLTISANSPSMLAGTVNCTGLTRTGDELVQTYSAACLIRVVYPAQKPTILNTKNGRLYVQADRPVVITCQAQGGNPTLQASSINMSCDGVRTGPPVTPVQRGGVWIGRITFIPRFPTHNGATCWCRLSTEAPRSHTFRKDTWAILVVESQSTPTTEASSARTTGTDQDSDGEDDGDDDSDREVSLAAIVGVAVGGASVVAIAVLVVIVFIRKGQLTYAKSLPEVEDNAHSYFDLETYEPVSSAAFYGREIRAGIAQSSAYENTDACRQLAARDDIYENNQIRASNSQQNMIYNMYGDRVTDGQEATLDDIYENRVTIQHLYQNRVSIGQGSEPQEIYENIEREHQQAVSGEMIYDNWAVGARLAPPDTLYGNTSAK